ncbi:MAG: glycosyltransferase [Lachnospiraceae bacterium]|nr:glycosyltransferase [Lachnospiraceae bacterium]
MTIFKKRKFRKEYRAELLKQTDPYQYYIQNMESRHTGDKKNPPKKDPELSDRFEGLSVFPLQNYYVFIKEDCTVEWGLVSDTLQNREDDLVYFDHDYLTAGKRHTPFFKPEWSFDTFMSVCYIEEIFAINKDFFEDEKILKHFRRDNSLYEFLFHLVTSRINISHISEIACHVPSDYSDDEDVYSEYVKEHGSFSSTRIRNIIHKEASYAADYERFSVTVIIPTKDHSEILSQCLNSIIIKSNFNKLLLEVIIVDNGSSLDEKLKITSVIDNIRSRFEVPGRDNTGFSIKYIYEPMDFNFSFMCDLGARMARHDFLLFLNNDIELKDEFSIEKLCRYAAMPDAGAVGCKLYYPDSTLLQHVGITDLDCGPSHKLSGHDDKEVFYFGVNRFNRNVLAVTGACLMMRKEKYFNIGGFNVKMKVSYNDVDLCLKCLKKGYRNILINETVMYHHESLMRGRDDQNDERFERLATERELLYRSNEWLKRDGDPYYSRKLISDTLDYRINVMPDYERRFVQSEIRELKPYEVKRYRNKALKLKKPFRHIKFSIDNVAFERGMTGTNGDKYLIDGWLINDARDNSCFERLLILISDHDDTGFEAELLPKYRTDVKKVHKKAKNADLAGFVCKFPAALLNKKENYQALLLLRKKGKKHGRIAVAADRILQGDV